MEINQKYPKSMHLHFSPGLQNDDRMMPYMDDLIGREVVVTEKLDGGNTCFKREGVFARTHAVEASGEHFDYAKAVYARIKYIFLAYPDLRIFSENMYAIHTLEYDKLTDYLYTFGIVDGDEFMSWDEIEGMCVQLGLTTVPLLFRGTFQSLKELEDFSTLIMQKPSILGVEKEGFVVRISDRFPVGSFSTMLGKYVRKNHVQTDEHWSKNWKKASLVK